MGLDQYHRERPRGDRLHRDAPVEGCVHCREEAANSLHIHGRPGECPVPGCQEAAAPELPTVLYRVELAIADDLLHRTVVRYHETVADAIGCIEDEGGDGAGLRGVHRLMLHLRSPAQWVRLDYQPSGPGRLTVKPA